MAWTDLTFPAGSVLTGTKMTQLDENFDALAAQNAGAPLVFFPNSGTYGAQVFSLATVHAESGFVGPQVSSLGTVHAESGFVGPEVSSFGAVEVNSNLSVFGGLRWPHFALRYDAGNPPTIVRQINVSCLERVAAGEYSIHVNPAFTNSSYYLLEMGGSNIATGQHNPAFRAESSNLSRVAIRNILTQDGTQADAGIGLMVLGFGD